MADLIQKTDSFNQGRGKLNEAITQSNDAITKSDQALSNSQSTQDQLDQVVIDGDSSVEAAQARVDKFGISSNTLKERTDLQQYFVNVQSYGAVGDGVTDDRQAIQSAIDEVETNGGGTIFFPYTGNAYIVGSAHSTYTTSGIVIQSNNVKLVGAGEHVEVRLTLTGMSELLYLPVNVRRLMIENINLNANSNADYALNTADVNTPYCSYRNARFDNGLEGAMRVATFVTTFDKCIFANSKRGLIVRGIAGGGDFSTSCTFNSCYALNNSEVGYDLGLLVYSTLNACACDNMSSGVAYRINGRGVTLNGCGAEKVYKVLEFTSFRGVTINSFFAFDVGSEDSLNPTPYLFEFVTGEDATLSGVHVQDSTGRYYDYKLGLTSSSYGYENITVTDNSLTKGEVYSTSNFRYNHPIKLLSDVVDKPTTKTIDISEIDSEFTFMSNRVYEDDYTLQLNDGSQPDRKIKNLLHTKGKGKIIIQGNASDNTLVTLDNRYQDMTVDRCENVVVFKDITFDSSVASTGNLRAIIKHSHVIFDNCRFIANVNSGGAIDADDNSIIEFINGTEVVQSGYWNKSVIDVDVTSKFQHESLSSPPSTGAWNGGLTIPNSNPTAGGVMGWVRISGAWKGYGAIET